jgi:hypothetical protein
LHVFVRALVLVLLLFPCGPVEARPATPLTEAVSRAETYIVEHKIPNEDRYLSKVTWNEDLEHPERSCWSLMWLPDEVSFDGQLVVWVFADGHIEHQDGNG